MKPLLEAAPHGDDRDWLRDDTATYLTGAHAYWSGRPAEALAIVPQICEALQFAHDEGIVHRDIKPANIMYEPESDQVKVADFGILVTSSTALVAADFVM